MYGLAQYAATPRLQKLTESATLIAAMSTPPSTARGNLIDDTIRRLQYAGIWSKLDVLWVLAAADSQAAYLNWKSPSTFTCTAVNTPTFTADQGVTGNGTSSYLNTGWVPSTNGVQFTQNDASMGVWQLNDVGGGVQLGARTSTTACARVATKNGFTNFAGLVNASTAASLQTTNSNSMGFYVGNRTSSTAVENFKNGASFQSGTLTSASLTGGTVMIDAQGIESSSPDSFSAGQIAAAFLGGSLSATLQATFYAILLTYMQGVGAV